MEKKRDILWNKIDHPWDLIIIGGGITGAGILHEAAASGLHALLIEKRDFAFGTSSRSGKLVHGGIRYMRNRQFRVSYESVKQREALISEIPNMVRRLPLYYVCMESDRSPVWRLEADMIAYELFAGRMGVHYQRGRNFLENRHCFNESPVKGGFRYFEGLTDDSRLVLRILEEAEIHGGVAVNYAQGVYLLREHDGKVSGVVIKDLDPDNFGRILELKARVVINAAGYLVEEILGKGENDQLIHKSRGSHLIFPQNRLPVKEAFTYYHPRDQRIQFIVPWQGTLMSGTTDIDYDMKEEEETGEPGITTAEANYILEGLNYIFPSAHLDTGDIQSTFSGVRPLLKGGGVSSSKESRRYALWDEKGLITIAGGKLTIYRLMAHDVMRHVLMYFNDRHEVKWAMPELNDPQIVPNIEIETSDWLWLVGRYGKEAQKVLESAREGELGHVAGTPILWAEVRSIANEGKVVHLDDLMLRHTRLGLILPQGGKSVLNQIRQVAGEGLGWDESRWQKEIADFQHLWQKCYFLPN